MLAAAVARAYGVLSDPELRELWSKRRQASEQKARQAVRPAAAEQFRIRTDLLDATAQLNEGRQRLESGNVRGAFEYFEYACDIDPRPLHRGWRAWARYLLDTSRNGRLAQQELEDVLRAAPELEQGWAWLGEIAAGPEQSQRGSGVLPPRLQAQPGASRRRREIAGARRRSAESGFRHSAGTRPELVALGGQAPGSGRSTPPELVHWVDRFRAPGRSPPPRTGPLGGQVPGSQQEDSPKLVHWVDRFRAPRQADSAENWSTGWTGSGLPQEHSARTGPLGGQVPAPGRSIRQNRSSAWTSDPASPPAAGSHGKTAEAFRSKR